MPNKVHNYATPYEPLIRFKAYLTHLKAFGCLCFIASTSINRDKFMPRSHRCVLLGYPTGQNKSI